MKKVNIYLAIVIIAGVSVVSFWIYQKYFAKSESSTISFPVTVGNITASIKSRGSIVSQKEFDLQFPFSGLVQKIFVHEGQLVNKGDPLVALDTNQLVFEFEAAQSVLTQRNANLQKVIGGATVEDLRISLTLVAAANAAADGAKRNLIDDINDGYTKADDAIRNNVDQLFNNPTSPNPQLIPQIISELLARGDGEALQKKIQANRLLIEETLIAWKASFGAMSMTSDIKAYQVDADTHLAFMVSFLDDVASAVNVISADPIPEVMLDLWKADILSARAEVNAAIEGITGSMRAFDAANADLKLAREELQLKQTGSRPEDIAIARAQVQEAQHQVSLILDKLQKSTLIAPEAASVMHIAVEEREASNPGNTVITLFSPGYKIQSDISELEIGKIDLAGNNDVTIALDAFPGVTFSGKVVSVDPQAVDRDGDKYYRVDIYFDGGTYTIRSGMSADVRIVTARRYGVLKIPSLAVYKKENRQLVKVAEDDTWVETEVATGITDGESIEILSGLREGQTVIVSAD